MNVRPSAIHTTVESIDRQRLKPVEAGGLIRLGLPRDGGYVVPQAQVMSASVLLSLGMKDDWSFDKDVVRANAGVRVIAVDRSVGRWFFVRRIVASAFSVQTRRIVGDRRQVRKHLAVLRNAVDYFAFFRGRHRHIRKMVAGRDSASTVTIARLLQIAKAEWDHGVVLKMDIEGAEYELIPDIVSHQRWFGCVVVEFHALNRKASMFNLSVEALLEHFRIVHIHGNNYSACDPANDFPNAVEVTFVNKALLAGEPAPSQHDYPRAELDYPNLPGRPDHRLRFG
jgi:hypothetical protein